MCRLSYKKNDIHSSLQWYANYSMNLDIGIFICIIWGCPWKCLFGILMPIHAQCVRFALRDSSTKVEYVSKLFVLSSSWVNMNSDHLLHSTLLRQTSHTEHVLASQFQNCTVYTQFVYIDIFVLYRITPFYYAIVLK